MAAGLPEIVAGRAGKLAMGHVLTLWTGCVKTNAGMAAGNGRRLPAEMAQRIQDASRSAALATGLCKAEDVSIREYVVLYPESSNAELVAASVKGLRVYVKQCPDQHAMSIWRDWLRRYDTKTTLQALGSPDGLRIEECGMRNDQKENGAAPTVVSIPTGDDSGPLPEAMVNARFVGGLLAGQTLAVKPSTQAILAAKMTETEAPRSIRDSAEKMDWAAVQAEAEANAQREITMYQRNKNGEFQVMGKWKAKPAKS